MRESTTKPFWLVFRGHFLFDWDEKGVTVHVPVLEVPHPHAYKVSLDGTPTYAAIQQGNHSVTGMYSLKPLTEPDSTQHLRHTAAVQLAKPQNGLARIRLGERPSAIHVIAGRTVPAAEFRNGMAAATVLSPETAGKYRICDLAVWEYSTDSVPVFEQGAKPVKAFAVDGGLAMVFTADPQHGAGEAGHAGHSAAQAALRRGINDILAANQKATTYRFAEPMEGAPTFDDVQTFTWLRGLFPGLGQGLATEGPGAMGSCDQDNTGPVG